MSAISSAEVARVAALARVALTPEEVTRLAGELDAVASSFARVTSVVTPDLPATSHPVPLTNVLREDVPGPTLDVDELLAGAPAAHIAGMAGFNQDETGDGRRDCRDYGGEDCGIKIWKYRNIFKKIMRDKI